MRCTVTGDPYTVFGYKGLQVRDNIHSADLVARLRGLPPRSAAGCGLQHGRRALQQLLDARGDRAVRGDRRARARLDAQRRSARMGDHRWWISDLDEFRPGLPGLGAALRPARDLTEIHDQNVERWQAAVLKLSVVMPGTRRGGHGRVHRARDRRRRSTARGSSTRCSWWTITAATAPSRSSGDSSGELRQVRCIPSPYSGGFGLTVRAGLEQFEGDAVTIMMADALRRPAGPRALSPATRSRATTARSGRASSLAPSCTTTRGSSCSSTGS